MTEPETILITGGAGFIGAHLCRALLAQGHRVVCLDNFYSGRRENVAELEGQAGFTLVEHDVVQAMTGLGFTPDKIYHLASPASPEFYQKDPVYTLCTNVVGTLNALELARQSGARLLLASTSEIYGDPQVHPQPEDYHGNVNPTGPRACYDEGKRAAETLTFDYRRMHGLSIKVVRIFNTFGPYMRENDGRVVSNFILQALRGEPITIYGDGKQTRSFCYVDDLVAGLMAMMESAEGVTGPVNLGNTHEITMLQLAKDVIAATGSCAQIVHKPLPVDDPLQRQPDLARAKSLLGWSPQVDFADGLKRTVEYFGGVAG